MSSRAWRTGVRAYDAPTFNNSDSNEVPVFYRSRSNQATDYRISGLPDPRRLWEDRTPTGLHNTPNLQGQPHSRQQIYTGNGDMGRDFHPRLREIFRQSPPRSPRLPNTLVPQVVENSTSTALSKLKKEVYNPTPKRLASRLGSFYKDNILNAPKEREKEKDEDGKRCAICLEDFVPKEEVMLTQCKHMFHEDCIVPWLQRKGQCPVCRFVICERSVRGNTSSFNGNDIANMEPSHLIAGELLSILRAMEVTFQLRNGTH